MKLNIKLLLLAVFLAAVLAWPGSARAQGPDGTQVVFGQSYTLSQGETLEGNLVVLGGSAKVEDGATVEGDVIVMGGTVNVAGIVDGNITVTGGAVNLANTAVVAGDITTAAGQLNRADGARVEGRVTTGMRGPFNFMLPSGVEVPGVEMRVNPLWDLIWKALWLLLRTFLWAALAVVVVLFLPRYTERAANTAANTPFVAGGLGLLTVIVLPLLLVAIFFTIILIPVTFLGFVVLGITWAYGLIVVGTEVGRRLGQIMKQDWALPVAAGIGTFLLILVVDGIGYIPCLGWFAQLLAGTIGLGALILTRYGTQVYPPFSAQPPAGGYPPVVPVVASAPETPAAPPLGGPDFPRDVQ